MPNLPKQIVVAYHGDWNALSRAEQVEMISNWLSDHYEYCHNGFAYQERDGRIHIIDIDWDITE